MHQQPSILFCQLIYICASVLAFKFNLLYLQNKMAGLDNYTSTRTNTDALMHTRNVLRLHMHGHKSNNHIHGKKQGWLCLPIKAALIWQERYGTE